LEFDSRGFEDLAWWIEQDRAQALRIIRLIREVQREPFKGIGWIEQDRAQALRIIRLIREVQREPFKGIGKPEPL
jgi:Txe/YoeB family toxin of Txe-Axe toxin-antitoxin module